MRDGVTLLAGRKPRISPVIWLSRPWTSYTKPMTFRLYSSDHRMITHKYGHPKISINWSCSQSQSAWLIRLMIYCGSILDVFHEHRADRVVVRPKWIFLQVLKETCWVVKFKQINFIVVFDIKWNYISTPITDYPNLAHNVKCYSS